MYRVGNCCEACVFETGQHATWCEVEELQEMLDRIMSEQIEKVLPIVADFFYRDKPKSFKIPK